MTDQRPVPLDLVELGINARATYAVPAIIAAAGEKAGLRFLEFFAANIRNPHTRRAYGRAVTELLAWCDHSGVPSVTAVQPLHVAAWIEMQQQECAARFCHISCRFPAERDRAECTNHASCMMPIAMRA